MLATACAGLRLSAHARPRGLAAALRGISPVVQLSIIPTTPVQPPALSLLLPGITLVQEALLVNGLWWAMLSLSKQKSLTRSGLAHATILGIGLWSFLGPPGWLVCVAYLVMGSLVTKVKMREKEALGIAEKRGGARGPENVWGAAATVSLARFCAFLSLSLL